MQRGSRVGTNGPRWAWGLLALACAVPLLLPAMPPLVDLYGHMARYRVLADLPHSPELQRYFAVDWRPAGNLGVDLLVLPLARLLPLEVAVKLAVSAIPVLTAGGILILSRIVHGRISPLAVAALPLIYSFVFHFGFVNFALGQALALLLLAAWGGRVRTARPLARALLLGLGAMIVWLAHAAAWGAALLMLAGWELASQLRERSLRPAAAHTAWRLLPALLPIVPTLAWGGASGAGPVAATFFDWAWKWSNLRSVLLEPGGLFDLLSLLALQAMVVANLILGKARADRRLLLAALLLGLAVLLMPYRLLGSNLADVRFIPLTLILALAACDPERARKPLMIAALLFLVARLGGNALHYWRSDQEVQANLPILDAVPVGGSLLTLYAERCGAERRAADRLVHFGSLATVRRLAFTNDQFPGGGTPLRIRYPAAGAWTDIYHGQVVPASCLPFYDAQNHPVPMTTEEALARFPRGAFSHVLLVRPVSADPRAFAGLRLVKSSGDMRLYQVQRPGR